jgi:hypothetical protein
MSGHCYPLYHFTTATPKKESRGVASCISLPHNLLPELMEELQAKNLFSSTCMAKCKKQDLTPMTHTPLVEITPGIKEILAEQKILGER